MFAPPHQPARRPPRCATACADRARSASSSSLRLQPVAISTASGASSLASAAARRPGVGFRQPVERRCDIGLEAVGIAAIGGARIDLLAHQGEKGLSVGPCGRPSAMPSWCQPSAGQGAGSPHRLETSSIFGLRGSPAHEVARAGVSGRAHGCAAPPSVAEQPKAQIGQVSRPERWRGEGTLSAASNTMMALVEHISLRHVAIVERRRGPPAP
jgi:hypothetical protein